MARLGNCFFSVLHDFRLAHMTCTSSFGFGSWQCIRVVGAKGKVHKVDSEIQIIDISLWTLWIWEGKPLAQLDWD